MPAAARSDFVFVNLAGGEVGRAMTDGRAREVVAALGRRAGIERVVTPHQFRHGLGTELVESGRSLDEVQMILGHARVETTRRYVRTSRERLRDAVESVAVPSLTPGARRGDGRAAAPSVRPTRGVGRARAVEGEGRSEDAGQRAAGIPQSAGVRAAGGRPVVRLSLVRAGRVPARGRLMIARVRSGCATRAPGTISARLRGTRGVPVTLEQFKARPMLRLAQAEPRAAAVSGVLHAGARAIGAGQRAVLGVQPACATIAARRSSSSSPAMIGSRPLAPRRSFGRCLVDGCRRWATTDERLCAACRRAVAEARLPRTRPPIEQFIADGSVAAVARWQAGR